MIDSLAKVPMSNSLFPAIHTEINMYVYVFLLPDVDGLQHNGKQVVRTGMFGCVGRQKYILRKRNRGVINTGSSVVKSSLSVTSSASSAPALFRS